MDTFIVWSADTLEQKIQSAFMMDNATDLAILNQHLGHGTAIVKTWVQNTAGGRVILMNGVEGAAVVPDSAMAALVTIRQQMGQILGSTVSIGVSMDLAEARKAMKAARVRGGDRILFYTPDLDKPVTPEPQNEDALKPLLQETQKSEGGDSQAKFLEAGPEKKEEPAPALDGAINDPSGIKTTVMKILQQIKGQKQTLDQLKQVAPETHQALMGAIQAMILMARSLMEGQGNQDGQKDSKGNDGAQSSPGAKPQPTGSGDMQEQAVGQEREMALGMQEEMKEHGISEAEALKLATDHLKQDPQYYTKKQPVGA